MTIELDIVDYPDPERFEHDVADALAMVQEFGKQYKRRDSRFIAAERVLTGVLAAYKWKYWEPVYIVASGEPEKHERECLCGECYNAGRKRMCYRAFIYTLHGFMKQNNYARFHRKLFRTQPFVSFSSSTFEDVVRQAFAYCDQQHLYPYDPVKNASQIV